MQIMICQCHDQMTIQMTRNTDTDILNIFILQKYSLNPQIYFSHSDNVPFLFWGSINDKFD